MPDLYRCILNPSGPNYSEWFHIFGGMNVPLESPYPEKATLGDDQPAEVYRLHVRGMTLQQRARLFFYVSQKFDVPLGEVGTHIERCGFAIRAEDVVVSYEMRAFV